MKNTIVITGGDWQAIINHFSACQDERMAFAYCGSISLPNERQYLIRFIDLPEDGEYRFQGIARVSLKAECVIPRIARAKGHAAFIDAHVHPFTECPTPSSTDNQGANEQFKVLQDLAPNTALIRMVFGRSEKVWAEVSDPDSLQWKPINEIVILGLNGRRVLIPFNISKTSVVKNTEQLRDTRTIAVLGTEGASTIRNVKVAVLGVGGVGSSVTAQLRGYVDHLTLVDPDTVELHNAPRLYHYADGDEGRPKVAIHKREVHRAFPHATIETLQTRFPDEASLNLIKQADIIFCCPDHNAVRYAAAQVGARFMKPIIEVGCGGKRIDGQIVALGYHVRLQVPGANCLACNGLDLRGLEDQSSTDMKRHIGYLNEDELIAGELMPLTTRAAADAVDMFFRYMNGYTPLISRHLYFDALRFQTIDLTNTYTSHPDCTLCGDLEHSLIAMGDAFSHEHQILVSL